MTYIAHKCKEWNKEGTDGYILAESNCWSMSTGCIYILLIPWLRSACLCCLRKKNVSQKRTIINRNWTRITPVDWWLDIWLGLKKILTTRGQCWTHQYILIHATPIYSLNCIGGLSFQLAGESKSLFLLTLYLLYTRISK